MKHFINYLVISIFVISTACQNNKPLTESIERINLDAITSNDNPLNLDDIFDLSTIQYLENSERAFMKFPTFIRVVDNSLLLVKTTERVLLFSLESGELMKVVAKKGQAPGEFYRSLKNITVPQITSSVLTLKSPNEIVSYGLENELDQHYKIPDISDMSDFQEGVITGFALLPNKTVLGYVMNTTGNESIKLIHFDSLGRVLKKFPNHLSYKKKPGLFRFESPSFHFYDNKLHFKEVYNDTLFYLSDDKLIPKLVFHSSNKVAKYKDQDQLSSDDKDNIIFVSSIKEDSEFVYFNYEYTNQKGLGLYNKKTKSTGYINNKSDNWLNQISTTNLLLNNNSIIFVAEAWQTSEMLLPEDLFNNLDADDVEEEQNPIIITLVRKKP